MDEKLIIGGLDMWGNMLATQALLQRKYEKEMGIDPHDMEMELMMALRDEVMEYAKSTRCFKVWSKADPDPKDIRLEEFVDALSFFMNEGMELGMGAHEFMNATRLALSQAEEIKARYHMYKNDSYKAKEQRRKKALTYLLSRAMDLLSSPDAAPTKEIRRINLSGAFICFYAAGLVDRLTDEDIEKAYYRKNKKNQERLKSGY